MKALHFYGLIIFTTFLMGSSFAVVKLGLVYASPLLLAALRFIIAGGLMAIVIAYLKQPLPKTTKEWLQIICIGALQTAGVMGCIFLSLRTITASESSILTFMNPLLVIIFGTLFFTQRYYTYQWVGVICGFIGVFITMGGELKFEIGMFIGFSGAVFWAFSTLLMKKWNAKINTWVLTAYQMLSGGIILLLLSFIMEKPFFITTAESIGIVLWLSILSSVVQFALWFYLLEHGEAGKTSSFLFLAPFFGVLTGALVFKDPLSWSLIAGSLFIIAGIYLVNRPRRVAPALSYERAD